MKQIRGSVRVKIKAYVMHGPSFFSFHFSSFSISFPRLTIFTILRLNMVCEISSCSRNSISPLSPYNWIGEHEIAKLKKKYLLRTQKKGHKNKHKKTWMKCNDRKWTIWYLQQCACVNAIYFAPVVTRTYRMKSKQGVWALSECPCLSACSFVKYALH